MTLQPIDHSKEPIKLPEKWRNVLINQPESGMGYQNVMLKVKGQSNLIQGLVLNCENLVIKTPIKVEDIEDINTIAGSNPFGVKNEVFANMFT
jgi:hypothetical protein